MSAPERRVDEHGFPIPQGFENSPGYEPAAIWPASKAVRIALFVIIAIAAIAVVFGPQIWESGKEKLAARMKSQAVEKLSLGDPAGAREEIERVMFLTPDDLDLIFLRGHCYLAEDKLKESLADFNKLIELAPSYGFDTAQPGAAYRERSIVFQRLGRHREAIDDSTRYVSLTEGSNASALNHRAYARAIGKLELEEGLEDINQALKIDGSNDPAFLDTRAYLLHLLGKNEDALVDMEKAIKAVERQRDRLALQGETLAPAMAAQVAFFNENLAVMYHHRGLIHQDLGDEQQAQEDLALAKELGYNPEKGVY